VIFLNFKDKIKKLSTLPDELAKSRVLIIGDCEVRVENYKGLIEYTSEVIRLKCLDRNISVLGSSLEMREVTREDVSILGKIREVDLC
jgi:sporulation protein YqfC